jgi:hypothetical protein
MRSRSRDAMLDLNALLSVVVEDSVDSDILFVVGECWTKWKYIFLMVGAERIFRMGFVKVKVGVGCGEKLMFVNVV